MKKTLLTLTTALLSTTLLLTTLNLHAAGSTAAATLLLFEQVSESGSLVPLDSQHGIYRLTLHSPNPFITYFSEAPNRYTGMMPLSEFFQHWNKGNIFKQQFKPNAALEAFDTTTKIHVNRTLKLSDPTYNAKTQTVTYKVTLLGNQGLPNAKIHLGYTVLFIDDFHWSGDKFHHGG